MAAPHNAQRVGEEWDPEQLALLQEELDRLRELVTVSGGWARHFLTPDGHRELKHAHDHKDADLFIPPAIFPAVVRLLKPRCCERVWTRFNGTEGSERFYRFVRSEELHGGPVKLMLDLFLDEVPSVEAGGFRVVEPNYLLSFSA